MCQRKYISSKCRVPKTKSPEQTHERLISMLAEVFSHGDGEAINLIYAQLSHAFISPLTPFPLTPLADLMTEPRKVTFETYTFKITWNKVSINLK